MPDAPLTPLDRTAAAARIEDWHLVRLPTPAQLARRRGFPPDRVDNQGMRAWCARTCAKGWQVQETTVAGTVYLFEDRGEAVAFALRWFPFKCG